MATKFISGELHSRWTFVIGQQPSGFIELWQTVSGWVLFWSNKPSELVNILGVACGEDGAYDSTAARPWSFFERSSALQHFMKTSGIAFRGNCGLLECQYLS